MCNDLFFGFIESYDCYVLMLFFDFFIVSFCLFLDFLGVVDIEVWDVFF